MTARTANESRNTDNRKERTILLVGSSETCPDLLYASGFHCTDPVIFFQDGKTRYLVVSPMEAGRARRLPGVEVMTPATVARRKGKRVRGISPTAVALLRHLGKKRVEVPGTFPHGVAKHLERAGIVLRVARGPIFPERAIKKPGEIRAMSESQQAAVISVRRVTAVLADATVNRSGQVIRHGKVVTAETLRAVIQRCLLDHCCFCREVIVACGILGADPHERGHGPLKANQPIVIDIFPQHLEHGYWGDLTRTVVKGHAPQAVRKMYAAVKAAQAAAFARIRPGVKFATVHRAAAEEIRRRGFVTDLQSGRGFIHGTGHGVGLEVHESPSIALGEGRLRKGNVITVEPGLYDPEIGGMRIEDTVVVTGHGWKTLAPCERRLEIH